MLSSGQFLRHSFDLCIRAVGMFEKLVGAGSNVVSIICTLVRKGLTYLLKTAPLTLLLFTALIEKKNLESF